MDPYRLLKFFDSGVPRFRDTGIIVSVFRCLPVSPRPREGTVPFSRRSDLKETVQPRKDRLKIVDHISTGRFLFYFSSLWS